MINNLTYCTRCCLPETVEGIRFDEMGICTACQSSEQKMHIDWTQREGQLREILERAKASAQGGYDCIIPISGGKDSFFQLHVLVKQYKMNPLTVTFNHNWLSETGYKNLMLALETFDVDHIQYTPNRRLVNHLARKSLTKIGDSCWHCHAGVGAFPLQVAVKWKIPLLIWGESIAESSGRASYDNPVRSFDREYFEKVSAKVPPSEMFSSFSLSTPSILFETPSVDECEAIGLHGIHLGDFLFWDDERQMEFVRDTYGWHETEMEGTYKCYKSAECIMAGVHDYTCYLKRGFGRGTVHASQDVRAGLLTREEGFELAQKYDPERPHALDFYLKETGYTEQEFREVMDGHRHPQITKPPQSEPKARSHSEPLIPYPIRINGLDVGRHPDA